MFKFELKDHEYLTLLAILKEHSERLGSRTTIPKGKTILCVAQEVALCEKLTENHLGVEIGERVEV